MTPTAQKTTTDVPEPAPHGESAKSEDRSDLRLLVDGLHDYAIIMLDVTGHVMSWNSGAERIKGYRAAEIIGQHMSRFYGADDIAAGKPEEELRQATEVGRYEEEGWRIRKDGTRFWANVIITPLRDPDGRLRGFGKITRDLSERKGAEERYRMLVESVRDYAIFLLDPSGKIRTWNAGGEALNGYKVGEVLGRHFGLFYTPEDVASGLPARELVEAASAGRYEQEGWRVRKDGTRLWANVVITRLLNESGEIIGYAKVTRDLTERRRAEAAVRESEERFRLLIDGVRDYAIIMLDPTGCVVSWNLGAERIKGWRSEEIIGRHFSLFYPPEDVKAGKTERELAHAERDGRFEDHGWRVRKDGTRFWANVVISALRDADGLLRGFGKITRDISAQRIVEDERRSAQVDLEARVAERTRDLLVSNRELEAFSYSISHDLRAPLRSMDGFSEVLLRNSSDKLDERSRDYLRRIRDSAQQMGRLIEGLLSLARLGRAALSFTLVDLSALATSVIAELRKAEPERDVTVEIAPGMAVTGDATVLAIVYRNLIENAWKYTSKRAKAKIEIGMAPTAEDAVFFVRDDGVGFDMAYIAKLFGVFQRLHGPAEFPGTGIGLATVKRVVQRHGGQVWAEGELDRGSTFYFSIPNSGLKGDKS